MPEWLLELPWGTVLTGVVAIYGALLSTFNFRAQRGRDRATAAEVLKKQAEQVTGWLDIYDGPEEQNTLLYSLLLQNKSDQPVYDVIASIVRLSDHGLNNTRVGDGHDPYEFRSLVGVLPPGQKKTRIEQPGQGMHRRWGLELAFQDAAGAFWLRQGNGILKKIKQNPVDLYGIPRPVGWGIGTFPR
jgi:hypothetical protein